MEQDGQGLGVGGEDDNLRDTTVEGLGGLVGALLELAGVCDMLASIRGGRSARAKDGEHTGSRLDEVQDLLLQLGVGKGPGYRKSQVSESRWRGGISAWCIPADSDILNAGG